jgi:hypothetical protein
MKGKSTPMVYLCLFGLFAVSNLAIVAGYYNTSLGVSLVVVSWVYESIPVFKASIALALLLPLNTALAFFTSRGKYETYAQELIALNLTTPFLVIFVILPGQLEKPAHLQLNLYTLIFIAIGAQLFFSRFLAKRAWVYGGRSLDT